MRQLVTFTKKEFMELNRTNKLLILGIVFLLFGIMNPGIAKLTPWLMETMASELESSGLFVKEVTVTALDSWMQFFKNIPMAIIVFILMFSGILTNEYQKGTLINIVTKGLSRWKIIISKLIVMLVAWTLGYWMCFGVTYVYNEYYWDNSIASNLGFSVIMVYILGVWFITMITLLSGMFNSNTSVAIVTAVVFGVLYVLSMLPDVKKYLPVKLMDSSAMIYGEGKPEDFMIAIVVTGAWCVINIIVGIVAFNKKNL